MSLQANRLVNIVGILFLGVIAYFVVVQFGWLLLSVIGVLFFLVLLVQSELQRQAAVISMQRQQIEALQASTENLSLSLMDLRNQSKKDDWDE